MCEKKPLDHVGIKSTLFVDDDNRGLDQLSKGRRPLTSVCRTRYLESRFSSLTFAAILRLSRD